MNHELAREKSESRHMGSFDFTKLARIVAARKK